MAVFMVPCVPINSKRIVPDNNRSAKRNAAAGHFTNDEILDAPETMFAYNAPPIPKAQGKPNKVLRDLPYPQ
jgi:hypothetical protein